MLIQPNSFLLSGINLAFTQALFAAGCSVLIADLRLHDDAALWLKSIEGHRSSDGGTPQVIFHETDVTVWKELELLFDVYANRIGGTPFLVCPGAGLYEPVRRKALVASSHRRTLPSMML